MLAYAEVLFFFWLLLLWTPSVRGQGTVSNGTATLSVASLPAGSGPLTAQYAGDTNPALRTSAAVQREVAVAGSAQTITFPQPPSPAYAGTSVALSATSSSGGSVTYTVISGPATVNGATLTYTGPGTVMVEADQPGASGFSPALPVQDTVDVTLLTEPVGTASPALTGFLFFSTGGSVASIEVLTQGAPNLDFNAVPGGTCVVGQTYTAGQTCTVQFVFDPTHPGLRYGGVILVGADGSTLANTYVFGEGTGPQLIFNPGLQTALGSNLRGASGVAINGSGDLFVSSRGGSTLLEIPASGGPAIPLGAFSDVEDVAVDGSGNVFLINGRDTVSEVVAVNGIIPAAPSIRTVASGFAALNGIKVDQNGNILLANSFLQGDNAAVFEIPAVNGSIPASPTVLTLGGGFGGPTGVAEDANGNVFVSDESKNAVFEMLAVNGSIPSSPAVLQLGSGFNSPSNVALDAVGNVYVTDYGNAAVKEIEAVGGTVPALNPVIKILGTGFNQPQGLVVGAEGDVYVADSGLPSVTKLDYADPPTLSFATTPVGVTSTDSPQSVTLINDGNAPLEVLPPSTGLNPTITPGFVLGNNSSCPQLSAQANAAAELGPGAACTDVVSFAPVAAGPDNGVLVTTDNNLNLAGATQTVVLNGTGLAVTSTLNLTATPTPVFLLNPVTLSATATSNVGTPTGSVTFLENGAVLGAANLNGGVANLVLSNLGVGSHSIVATYGSIIGPVTSTAVTVMVEDFSLSFSQNAVSIPHGGTATYSLTIHPIGGAVMPAAIDLAVSGAPDSSTITLSPVTVLSGSGSTTVTLTIATPDYPVGPFSESRPANRALVFAVASLLLFGMRKRRFSAAFRWLACLIACLVVAAGVTGCGSGWGTQQYSVVVTGSSGALSHATTSSLTSQ